MNTKHTRDYLLKELEEALALAGPQPRRWQSACCARLSAFVESDEEAARLFAEAKALDRVLCRAPEGKPGAALESCILRAAFQRSQDRGVSPGLEIRLERFPEKWISVFRKKTRQNKERERFSGSMEVENALGGAARSKARQFPFRVPSRSFWGEAALLAASLALGVYIGVSGEAVPTLRDLDMIASADGDAAMAFSGSLFEPGGLHDREQL